MRKRKKKKELPGDVNWERYLNLQQSYLKWRGKVIDKYGEISGKAKILHMWNTVKSDKPGERMKEIRDTIMNLKLY